MKNTHTKSPLILLKIFNDKGKLIDRAGGRKSKRIFRFFEAGNFQNCVFKVSVRYNNGWQNEGIYESKKELYFALKCFLEK